MDATEADRRATFKQAIESYFRSHPGEWIRAATLMEIGGSCAWRTRCSDARKVFEREGGVLQNRQQRYQDTGAILSEYRFLPYTPLARDAAEHVTQKSLW